MKNNNDTRLKVLSVIVAIVMWTFVVNSTNPSVNKTFRVPVVMKNQEDLEKNNLTIIGGEESYSTNVKLKGSREKIVALRPENVFASIDISEAREGVQSLAINVETPSGVSVEDADPGQINLNIQKLIDKTLPVNVVVSDTLKDSRIVEVNELSPATITVKGPASLVNTVDRVEVKIDDKNLIDGKVHNVNVSVLDRSGKPVEGLRLSHNDVNLSFIVYLTKSVPVTLNAVGTINSEYEEVSRTLTPDSVILKGPESIISEITEITTKPVNINNLRSTAAGEVKFNLPEAVEVYNGENSATYKIEVKKKPTINKEKEEESNEEDKDEPSR